MTKYIVSNFSIWSVVKVSKSSFTPNVKYNIGTLIHIVMHIDLWMIPVLTFKTYNEKYLLKSNV